MYCSTNTLNYFCNNVKPFCKDDFFAAQDYNEILLETSISSINAVTETLIKISLPLLVLRGKNWEESMVNMSAKARIWLDEQTEALRFYQPCRFFDKIRECCDYPDYIKDYLSAFIGAARTTTDFDRLKAFAAKFRDSQDPRATYELYLMGFKWGLKYPATQEVIEMAREAFRDHVSSQLNDLQRELLADMVRNSAEDGDFVFQALLPVVDSKFEDLFQARLDEAVISLKNYCERPDWEGDYFDQINVIMYEKRIEELEKLIAACRRPKSGSL